MHWIKGFEQIEFEKKKKIHKTVVSFLMINKKNYTFKLGKCYNLQKISSIDIS